MQTGNVVEAFLDMLNVHQQCLVWYHAELSMDTSVSRVNVLLTISPHSKLIKIFKKDL